MKFKEAIYIAQKIHENLELYFFHLHLVGSLRRECEEVNDIDFLGTIDNLAGLKIAIDKYSVNHKDNHHINIEYDGIKVDINLCYSNDVFGAMLVHHTGSINEVRNLREKAKGMGYNLKQTGLWLGNNIIPTYTELDVYRKLGLRYKIPIERV